MTARQPRSAALKPDDGAVVVPFDDARRAFLDASSVSTGTDWSVRLRTDLRREGRPAAGGFPGTMSEARACVHRSIPPMLTRAKMRALLPEEREWTARVAYAAARKDWLRHGESDED